MRREFAVKEVLGPGMWLDVDDKPHFHIPRILEYLGLPDNQDTRAQVQQFIDDTLTKLKERLWAIPI